MDISCPACGKNNPTHVSTACVRCGCDLSMLSTILDGAVWHLKESVRQLHEADWETALAHAEHSWTLHHSPRAAEAAFLASVAMGNPQDGLRWRRLADNWNSKS